ncbi:hypothetical protein RRG08_045588 [Elysia crispata]|uniref:Uncharacterized protein n=1 Tax=Elysia crispata TaxID=231223 RepID=A0AAE1AD58_9GAST|nr:hypothetical protein RRG08_045588 [Elysia crispata]
MVRVSFSGRMVQASKALQLHSPDFDTSYWFWVNIKLDGEPPCPVGRSVEYQLRDPKAGSNVVSLARRRAALFSKGSEAHIVLSGRDTSDDTGIKPYRTQLAKCVKFSPLRYHLALMGDSTGVPTLWMCGDSTSPV